MSPSAKPFDGLRALSTHKRAETAQDLELRRDGAAAAFSVKEPAQKYRD
jgi:hypothetical protein